MGARTTGGQTASGPSASARNSPGRAVGTPQLSALAKRRSAFSRASLQQSQPAPPVGAAVALHEANWRRGQIDAALAADHQAAVRREGPRPQTQQLGDLLPVVRVPGEGW